MVNGSPVCANVSGPLTVNKVIDIIQMICLMKTSDAENCRFCEGAMLVLITGGAGRLGITVVKRLLKEGFQVRVFDFHLYCNNS